MITMLQSLGDNVTYHGLMGSSQWLFSNPSPENIIPRRRLQNNSFRFTIRNILLPLMSTLHIAVAQNCVPLAGSTMCPAFPQASISITDSLVVSLFPFLQSVSSTASFDEQLNTYVSTLYVKKKYQDLLGCSNIDLTNTTNHYARFTTTVLCNSIIQNSRTACDLSFDASRPVCAETCAQQAESESIITANRDLCLKPGENSESEIRADFTNCALPANSLTSSCVTGITNEPKNCGFGNNTVGFCQYCASGGINSTDTCCYTANAQARCANVVLPTITSFVTFSTSLPTSTDKNPVASVSDQPPSTAPTRLSPGAISGIAIGSIAGLALLGGIFFLFMMSLQKRHSSPDGSIFNPSTPPNFTYFSGSGRNTHSNMVMNPVSNTPDGYEILPGGRIARMSALEGQANISLKEDSTSPAIGFISHRRHLEQSSSDEYSLTSTSQGKVLRPPPAACRTGSLSSNAVLGSDDANSPHMTIQGGNLSPGRLASPQSEQLLFFKDYYSADEIHPGDKVATLWAYQPRAPDEFELERGDMLKVTGIWDDGWATGIMINERAEEWDNKHNTLRDSGVANTIAARQDTPNISSEIKAFPLVCVCLPEHWKKTIDGDSSTEAGSTLPGSPK